MRIFLWAWNYFHTLDPFMFIVVNNKSKLFRQYPYIFLCTFRTFGRISPLFIQILFTKCFDFIYH